MFWKRRNSLIFSGWIVADVPKKLGKTAAKRKRNKIRSHV